MERANNQNALELVVQLGEIVEEIEEASRTGDMEGLISAKKNYLEGLTKCSDIHARNIDCNLYKKVVEKLSEFGNRISDASKPYLKEIYFSETCGRARR